MFTADDRAFQAWGRRNWINAVLVKTRRKSGTFVLSEVQPAKPECLCGLGGPFWNFAFHVSYGMP
jgi:hypothetical protein